MWNGAVRPQYARADLALPRDLTDTECAVLEPFLPQHSRVGQPPTATPADCGSDCKLVRTGG